MGGGEGGGAPIWIISFSDMTSLLCTFFIVLLTFSTKDEEKVKTVGGALQANLGVMNEAKKATLPNAIQKMPRPSARRLGSGAESPSDRKEHEIDKALETLVQDPSYKVKPEFEKTKDGVRISFREEDLFENGAETLSEHGRTLVAEVGNLFREFKSRIVVETHTDDRSFRLTRHGSALALTVQTAVRVAAVLVDRSGLDPTRVAILPSGSSRPVAENTTPQGRTSNRRVVLAIRKDST
jgi:chemotaxis protein MotB